MSENPSREERIRAIKNLFHYLMWVATRRFTQLLQPFGLTLAQFFVMAVLVARKQPCTMHDLTNITFQDPPTMTGIVDRLVKMGLVRRARSETDRRVVLVETTPVGLDLLKQVNEKIMQDAEAGYATLTDDDLDNFEQLLRYKIRTHIGRFKSLQDDELDAEIEKLHNLATDPMHYAKLENEKSL